MRFVRAKINTESLVTNRLKYDTLNLTDAEQAGLTHLFGEPYARLMLRSVPPKAGLLRRVAYERTSMKERNKEDVPGFLQPQIQPCSFCQNKYNYKPQHRGPTTEAELLYGMQKTRVITKSSNCLQKNRPLFLPNKFFSDYPHFSPKNGGWLLKLGSFPNYCSRNILRYKSIKRTCPREGGEAPLRG